MGKVFTFLDAVRKTCGHLAIITIAAVVSGLFTGSTLLGKRIAIASNSSPRRSGMARVNEGSEFYLSLAH